MEVSIQNKYIQNKKFYKLLSNEFNLKGGKKTNKNILPKFNEHHNEIVDFLTHSTKEEIILNLHNILIKDKVCDKSIGSGVIGQVILSGVGSHVEIKYPEITDNHQPILIKSVNIPVVSKESHYDSELLIEEINDSLFVYNYNGVNVEAMILYFVKSLIETKSSPHLPLILDHGKCMNSMSPVDKLVLEMHGLEEPISVDIPGLYETPMWQVMTKSDPTLTLRMSTFDDLCTYAHLTMKNNNIILPYGIECNFIELIDYLSISFLITYDLLFKHNIYLLDMHPANIFIHWLNSNSYMNDKFIGNVKYIFYKVGKTYYKIKTFGLILKIGDMGASIVKPQDNVYLVGQCNNMERNHSIVRTLTETTKNYEMINNLRHCLTNNILSKTVGGKISFSHPYDKLFWVNRSDEVTKDLLSTKNLLKYFDKYSTNTIDEDSDFLVF